MISFRWPATILTSLIVLLGSPPEVRAQWAQSGLGVYTDPLFFKRQPVVVSDGAGGAIVVWGDRRNDVGFDLFAQRLTAAGRIAPGWPAGGVLVSTARFPKTDPAIGSDDHGGVFVAWIEYRSTPRSYRLFAQHVGGDGKLADGWPTDGLPLSNLAGWQFTPSLVSDGFRGAVVVWQQQGSSHAVLYAQRVTAGGSLAAGWDSAGTRLCTAPGWQALARVAPDDRGGVFVTWRDGRSSDRGEVYAQHVAPDGTIPVGWPTDGLAIAVGYQRESMEGGPTISEDGSGGFFVGWHDSRSQSLRNWGLRVLRVRGNGVRVGGWPQDGIAVGVQLDTPHHSIVADGTGGAYVAWEDTYYDRAGSIGVQRLTGSGTVSSSWPMSGASVSLPTARTLNPVLASDADGVVVAWVDYRNGEFGPLRESDLFATRLTASGEIAHGWLRDGVALCTAPGDQSDLGIVPDGSHGAIAAWLDFRAGNCAGIYSARVLSSGFVPPLVPLDVRPGSTDNVIHPGSHGTVAAAVLSTESFDARQIRPLSVTLAGARVRSRGNGAPHVSYEDVDRDGLPDILFHFQMASLGLGPFDSTVTLLGETKDLIAIEGHDRVRIVQPGPKSGRENQDPEAVDDVGSGSASLTLERTWPRPSMGGTVFISFALGSTKPARLGVWDVAGREMFSLDVSGQVAGARRIGLPTASLPAGVYIVRLSQDGEQRQQKLVVFR